MSIYEYNEGDHPGGFLGLRVTVSINGNVKQKYFRFKKNHHEYISLVEEKALRKKAAKLHNEWMKLQKQAQAEAKKVEYFKHKRQSVYNTGIQGISMRFIIDKKWRQNQWKIYYTPAFRIQGMENKKKYLKTFYITDKSYSDAWIEAVIYFCKVKNIDDISPFLEKIPDKNRFKEIRRYMIKQGHNIPLSKLP